MKLTFKRLEIEREEYGQRKGQLSGNIRFYSKHADITFNLEQSHIDRIFEVVSQRMLEVAQEVSDELLADVIEAMPNPDLLDKERGDEH